MKYQRKSSINMKCNNWCFNTDGQFWEGKIHSTNVNQARSSKCKLHLLVFSFTGKPCKLLIMWMRMESYFNMKHGRRNHRHSGDVSPPSFGKFSPISKNIRQRSLQQTVQKLHLIMIFYLCEALLTLAMKVLGFSINIYSYLPAISNHKWFYPNLRRAAANV